MTSGADLVSHLARFSRALRTAGVSVVPSDTIDGAAALPLVDLEDRAEVRSALAVALKIGPRDRERFEALFEAWWGATPPGEGDTRRHPERTSARMAALGLPHPARQAGAQPAEPVDRPEGDTPGYSPHGLLMRKSFEQWSEDDLTALEEVLARLALRLATRRSRRLVPAIGGGPVDLRRSFRRLVSTSGELLPLARRSRPIERTRLVVLCDTSGSMDPHTRFLLAFMLSLRRVVKALEVFVFNTTLTRLTPWLSGRHLPAVLDRVAAEVPDWSGGTRIGECLEAFVRSYLTSMVTSRTVVVILSDGLDRGEPEQLRQAMRAIHDASRRVIWLNPLMGDARYEPTARGMQVALPYVDRLMPAHSLESLERMVSTLSA